MLKKLAPKLNFIRLHYAWIIFCSLLAFPILSPYNNLLPIDVIFFGCSGSTESGLNTVDVKDLKTYQQVYIYIIPIITNIMFINAMVVPIRLYWFRKHLKQTATQIGRNPEQGTDRADRGLSLRTLSQDVALASPDLSSKMHSQDQRTGPRAPEANMAIEEKKPIEGTEVPRRSTTISFRDPENKRVPSRSALNDEQPMDSLHEKSESLKDDDAIYADEPLGPIRRVTTDLGPRGRHNVTARQAARSLDRVASSAFVLSNPGPSRSRSVSRQRIARVNTLDLPQLSRQVTIGRNSQFYNLTEDDRDRLGGIEYRALKLLMKFVFGYFIGLHVLGVICLLPWIHGAGSQYTDWLEESGIGKTWWAIYSAQTMVNNLGFTLTPDSMAHFKDATWPMIAMTFMAFAGNTLYPVLLRLVIWTASKCVRQNTETKTTLQFLLDHPRRCYTLLFPSRPTWILFGIVFLLNLTDVILIICLDLDNAAVTDLPMGSRILSALFQAVSARHTGTSTLNLAEVNPAVQFSLLTMMYIAIFPIAISIRASNTDEERTLGIWSREGDLNEKEASSYVMVHIRNQLTFDLWYIFFGTFVVCIVEASRIMDLNEPSFSVFPVLFEVTSAYGNVGLSLGGPSGSVSMVGHYRVFSKLVICAMMIRGRHRGLPYALDRAIKLPVTGFVDQEQAEDDAKRVV